MRGLDKRISGLPRGSTSQHHLTGAGEFSTGEMGNFQPALTLGDNTWPSQGLAVRRFPMRTASSSRRAVRGRATDWLRLRRSRFRLKKGPL